MLQRPGQQSMQSRRVHPSLHSTNTDHRYIRRIDTNDPQGSIIEDESAELPHDDER